MLRLRVILGLMAIMLVMGGLLSGQDKQDPGLKVRGQLPPNWGKLNLTKEQRDKIYLIQAEYGGKVDKLKRDIDKLDQQMRAEREKVLTEAQKAMLREIAVGKTGVSSPPKEDKKDDKKPEKKP